MVHFHLLHLLHLLHLIFITILSFLFFVVKPISENSQKNSEEILVEEHQNDDHYRRGGLRHPHRHRHARIKWFTCFQQR